MSSEVNIKLIHKIMNAYQFSPLNYQSIDSRLITKSKPGDNQRLVSSKIKLTKFVISGRIGVILHNFIGNGLMP